MKYLVTGGSGFIGSNLVENLIEEDHEIVVIDNLAFNNLDNLKKVENKIEIIKAQAGDALKLVKGIDGIFHLGSTASSILLRDNHFLTSQDISEFINLLELAKQENCKIVYNSTSSIYNGNKVPYKETQEIFVADFYSEVRYMFERLSLLYYKLFGVKSIALRPFSVYGPHEESKGNRANLISQFLWLMKKDKSPEIWGDGNQDRDFVYVDDLIEATKLAMNSEIECDIFNVGSGKSYTIIELMETLNKVLNKDIKAKFIKNHLEGRAYFAQHHLADTEKAEKMLGFKTKVSLEDGIKKLC